MCGGLFSGISGTPGWRSHFRNDHKKDSFEKFALLCKTEEKVQKDCSFGQTYGLKPTLDCVMEQSIETFENIFPGGSQA